MLLTKKLRKNVIAGVIDWFSYIVSANEDNLNYLKLVICGDCEKTKNNNLY